MASAENAVTISASDMFPRGGIFVPTVAHMKEIR
jgi:hypothetical protein